jgi:hypothetical protein
MNKWQNFKERRAEVLDRYLKLKKLYLRGRSCRSIIIRSRMLKLIAEKIIWAKNNRVKEFAAINLSRRITSRCILKTKRRGGISRVIQNKARNIVRVSLPFIVEAARNCAKKIIADFIKNRMETDKRNRDIL